MPSAIVVRRGTSAEVLELRSLVLRPGLPPAEASWEGDDEPDARHWVAERAGRVIGIASVLRRAYPLPGGAGGPSGPAWQLRGMAVAPEERGAGVGRAVLDALVREVGEPLWCNARVTALAFYRGSGWREASDTFELAAGPHRRMVLERT